MSSRRPPRSLVPTVLGLAMLSVVIAAALAPNTGVVASAAACQYGDCNSGSSGGLSMTTLELIAGLIAALVVAALVAMLVLRRRSGGGGAPPAGASPSSGEAPAPEGMEGYDGLISSGEPGGTTAEPGSGDAGTEQPPAEPYDEGPPTSEPPSNGGGSGGSEDIDSLMQELEKLSKPK